MKRLVIIGKWLNGKKTTIIDLQAYKESIQKQIIKESIDQSSEKSSDQNVPINT
jgi:hypothetical protein